jgi:hypothetical protein
MWDGGDWASRFHGGRGYSAHCLCRLPPHGCGVAYCGLDSSTAKRGWMRSIKGHNKPDAAPVLQNSSTDTVELRELTEEDVKERRLKIGASHRLPNHPRKLENNNVRERSRLSSASKPHQ